MTSMRNSALSISKSRYVRRLYIYALFFMQASLGKVFGAHKIVFAARFPALKTLLTQQSELSRSTINLSRYSEG